MLVRFTKARHEERSHTLTCIRDDETVTGMPSSPFFVRHDLTHFAIETTLGLENAFYGLLAQGWEVNAFEEREPGTRKARKLPPEAHYAEIVAGMLDLDWATGPIPVEETVTMIADSLDQSNIEVRAPRPKQIEAIREKRSELMQLWDSLSPGACLELTFDARNPAS